MKTYKEIIRGLREDHDKKQSEIAEVAGTTQQHYSRYETGASEMPIRVLSLLADYYNVSADYIIGRTVCKEGVAGLNETVAAGITTGAIISDILSLNKADRAEVINFISYKVNTAGKSKRNVKSNPRA